MVRLRSMSAVVVATAALALGVTHGPAALADQDQSQDQSQDQRESRDRERFPARINLPDGWRPEGITAGRGNSLYVGSLATGAIWKADARTGVGAVLSAGVAGRVSVGVDYDRRTDRLWVAGGGTGEIRVVDASSGAVLQSFTVPGADGTGFLNDIAVTREAVYVTDSRRSLLVVISTPRNGEIPGADALKILPLTNGAIGNGIVAHRDALVIVQSGPGLLWKVDPATGAATQIDLGGYLVTNGDGLEARGEDLYVMRNRSNLVALLELDDDTLLSGRLVKEITSPGNLDVASTIAIQGGRLWAVNARFGTPSPETAQYWITQLPL
jgi:sugar lactone lactonase YvrE